MNLGLYMTRGVGIRDWIKIGILERELLIYRTLINQNKINHLLIFTYESYDPKIEEYFLNTKIKVIFCPKIFDNSLLKNLYLFINPFINFSHIKSCQVIKSNQFDGALSAVLAGYIFNKKIYLRSGYSKTLFISNISGKTFKFYLFYLLEKILYNLNIKIAVSSESEKKKLISNHRIKPNKINVIPNYVNSSFFIKTNDTNTVKNKLLVVGRICKQKNLKNLVLAVSEIKKFSSIDFFGKIDDENYYKELLEVSASVKLNFYGPKSSDEILNIFKKYKYYALVSFFEGMPKSLIEALASGCVCICSRGNGIEEIIMHGFNGFLSDGFEKSDLKKSLQTAIRTKSDKIIKNAIKSAKEKYSINYIVNKEINIYKSFND